MNKFQAEKKVYAFHAEFIVDVNDVNSFQNPSETSPFDHFPWSSIYAKSF